MLQQTQAAFTQMGGQQQRTRPTQGSLVERVLERWEAESLPLGWPHELVDIGVNLVDRSFEKDRDAVLLRAARAGVRTVLLTGTCVHTSRAAAAICDTEAAGAAAAAAASDSRPRQICFTVGVHPHNAKDCGPATIGELQALASHPGCRAIGEVRDRGSLTSAALWCQLPTAPHK